MYLLLLCLAGGGGSWFILFLEVGSAPQLVPFFAQQVPRWWVSLQGAPWLHFCPGWLGFLVASNTPGHSIYGSGPRMISHRTPVNFPPRGWKDHFVPGVGRLNPSPTSASHCLGTPPC